MKPRLRFLMWILIAGGVHGFVLLVPRPAGRGDEGIPTIELTLVETGAGEAGQAGLPAPAPWAAPIAKAAAPTPRPAAQEEAPALNLSPPELPPPAVQPPAQDPAVAVVPAADATVGSPAPPRGAAIEAAGGGGTGPAGAGGGSMAEPGGGTGTAVSSGAGNGSGASGAAMTAALTPPRPRTGISPVYPRGARAAGIEGTVRVTALVDASGAVASAEVSSSSGHAALDRAALDEVLRTVFQPAVQNGKPVPCRLIIPIRFQLQ
jgi:protein TonB